MVRLTRKQRESAREEALNRLPEIDAQEVRVNDAICSHVTVFFSGGERVEWWPGAQRWKHDGEILEGSTEGFIKWANARDEWRRAQEC